MRRNFAVALLFACLFARARCASAKEDARSAVLRVLSAQRHAWNHGDLKGFMRGYWDSDQVTFVSDGTIRRGWERVYERYVKTYGQNKEGMGHLDFSRITVIPLGREAALAYGRWDLLLPKGKKLGGIFSLVFEKFPDGWKIIHDHTSRDVGQ